MLAWLLSVLGGLLGKWLGRFIPSRPSPAQAAVNTESRMAGDVVNAPDQQAAVRALEAGDA